jgi:deoxyribodipyrimidine photolyase
MHNYLRMYWAKQFIRWMPDPAEAFQLAVTLNDRYSIDGRDCNGYLGVAWCFGATDRPFYNGSVFGAVRQMSAKGVDSRINTGKYVEQVSAYAPCIYTQVFTTNVCALCSVYVHMLYEGFHMLTRCLLLGTAITLSR